MNPDDLGTRVQYKGQHWHFEEAMHWHDGSIGPGLKRYEGKCQVTKRLHE